MTATSDTNPAQPGSDPNAADSWDQTLLPVLEQIAARHLMGERDSITLEASDLVQEAWLRLNDLEMPFTDQKHFLSMVSTAMRRVLVDHARRKQAVKRGQRPVRVTLLSREADRSNAQAVVLIELDAILASLAQADPRKARLADLHYFGGLTREEMAEVTGLSTATIGRELRFVRSWIRAQLAEDEA
ncbi:MAG: sigma-70 family RNA polymerase sigma factor [Wenzhouxiangella sp.]|nr:sigma-70 family RNA polymerase sigma factor [Wenzhouxiangella sp.]MCH8477750.1 sigma-70 family RNA polymerase sigma factor [Wenzhouxiangella sp.]